MGKMSELCILIAVFVLFVSGGIAENSAGHDQAQNTSLIPRDILFGNPDRITARISPDGSSLSFLAPVNGVLNVWVGPAAAPNEARPVTYDTYRGIRSYTWGYANDSILYLQDRNGDENWRIYRVNLTDGEVRDLTPFENVQAQILSISLKHPHECIVGLNKRDPSYHDLYRLDLETGNLTLILENDRFAGFEIDDDFRVRLASYLAPDGGNEIFRLADNGTWESLMKIGMEDTITTRFAGFNKTNDIIYLVDSRDRNTAALYELDLNTKTKTLVAEDMRADFAGSMNHPTQKNVQAVAFYYDHMYWKIIDPSLADEMEYLAGVQDGEMIVVSRSVDDMTWIVVYTVDDGPMRYYYYDRRTKQARFLFTDRERLQGRTLSRMIPVVIKSRDGLDLVSYYTLPTGLDADGDARPDHPLPMVLNVHGGPWSRDYWGLDSIHQWLANRGYAVLSVNFRGSTGFGKNFTNAGNLEWGRKMQEDLLDAVNWSVEEGIADPNRIAIMGGSYGGYATLAGLAFTPQTFACGVDIVGPSNLVSFMETIPPYWKPEIEQLTKRVGDFRTEKGRAFLRDRSPLTYVDRITRPLLIGQGANDPRVNQNESGQIVRAMQAKRLPVTYVLYADEGHGFARPENRLSFYAITEAFLARHLGGRFEPIGSDLQGANLTVPVGADEITGLAQAMGKRA